jgi:MFS family permease
MLSIPLYLYLVGISVLNIGLVVAGAMLFTVFLTLFLGMIGDRKSFRLSLILAEIPYLAAMLILSFTEYTPLIYLAVVVGGIGGAPGAMRGSFSPGSTALIGKNWPDPDERVRRIGLLLSTGSIGAVGGAFMLYVKGLLDPVTGSVEAFRYLFLVSAALMGASAIMLTLLKEKSALQRKNLIMSRKSATYSFRVILSNTLNGSGIGIAMSILPLWMSLRYGVSDASLGTIFTLSYVATGMAAYISSRLSGTFRIRGLRISSYTRILQGTMLILIGLSPLFILAWSLYVIRSFFAGFGAPMRSAININGISGSDYGTATSIQGVSNRLSMVSSGATGYLMGVGLPIPEEVGGILQFLAGITYYFSLRSSFRKG